MVEVRDRDEGVIVGFLCFCFFIEFLFVFIVNFKFFLGFRILGVFDRLLG